MRAVTRLLCLQSDAGAWEGEVEWSPVITAQVVIAHRIIGQPEDARRRRLTLRHFAATQRADGGWGLHPAGTSYRFVTTLVYVAARLLGEPPGAPMLAAARSWLDGAPDDVYALPSWGKFWLVLLGLYDRGGLHPCPPELFLLPDWVPVAPNRFYCYTRYVACPTRPVVTLRCGASTIAVRARAVVAADGAASSVRTLAGIGHRQRRLSTMVGVAVEDGAGDGGLPPAPGYGHVFVGAAAPVLAYAIGAGRVRVLVDLPFDSRPALREAGVHDALSALPRVLRAKVERAAAARTSRCVSHEVSVDAAVRGRVALVGDAGGSCHPLTATGMTAAVRDALALRAAVRDRPGDLGAAAPVQQVARELGVQYVLTGTVRWAKGPGDESRVQVTPELIQVATASAAWQEPFDAPVTAVFRVQADVAGRVAQALDVRLGAGERARLAERPTADLAAYDAHLQGEAASNALAASDPPTLRRAIGFCERAVALDPGFAQAWARLAEARSALYANGPGSDAATLRATARAAAERAIALAPDRPDGHRALGLYLVNVPGDNAGAAEQLALALRAAPADAELLATAALAQQGLGRWDAALEYVQRAAALDPRSPRTARRLGNTLLWLRRPAAAAAAYDRALVLAPDDLSVREQRAVADLARGDLAGARAVLRAAPAAVDPATLAAYVATYWDLGWVLDDAQQRRLLGAGPAAFGDDAVSRFAALTQLAALRGDAARTRAYADSARAATAAALDATPDDAQLHATLGLALAYLGRRAEAVREGQRAVALRPVSKDGFEEAYIQHQFARIYLALGERDAALDQLEPLLRIPYYLTPAWLRLDPTFAPLRGRPRFERLAVGR